MTISVTQLIEEDAVGSSSSGDILSMTHQILVVSGIIICGLLFVLVLAIGKKMGNSERNARLPSPSNLSHASLVCNFLFFFLVAAKKINGSNF